jgi:small subunit ribosomal protein S16
VWQVGILEPQFRVGQIQGQVIKADSAHKSLIPETPKVVEEVVEEQA